MIREIYCWIDITFQLQQAFHYPLSSLQTQSMFSIFSSIEMVYNGIMKEMEESI